jgi:hypothetical protein
VVEFGLNEFDPQLSRWRSVYDHGQTFRRNLAWMDLSVSNNVPARWLEASIIPAPPTRQLNPPRYKKRHV